MKDYPSVEFRMLCDKIKDIGKFMAEPLDAQKRIIARIGQLSKKLNRPIPKEPKVAISFFKKMYKEQRAISRRPRVIRRRK